MIEEDFAAALLDPDLPAPSTISPAHRSRFAIYRNNVALSLVEALATRFPAVRASSARISLCRRRASS